jgi:hypothetical protein
MTSRMTASRRAKTPRVPFENRWTSGHQGREWNCELDQLGVANVRAMLCEHEVHHRGDPAVIFNIPPGFIRDWLAFHDRQAARRQMIWRASVLSVGLVAASAAILAALR